MAVTDPVDARLLGAVAELGKAAVHEVAAKIGMDPREVAYRLVGLSATGLPLLVGVESDPNGLRAALAGAWQGQQPGPQQAPGMVSGAYQVPAPPSGPQQAPGTPSGPYPPPGTATGPYPPQAMPAQPHPHVPHPPGPQQAPRHPVPPQPHRADPVLSTWGPPQTAAWARGDQQAPAQAPRPAPGGDRTGTIGDVLETQGLEGESLAVGLLELQDPADFLFGAGGYRLAEGERAVVAHTEITNRGQVPFASLPDNYLELVTADGRGISKAPVSLTSRPPHKIGVAPGETAGGHTVYVLPDDTSIVSVRWSPRPEPDERSLLWSIEP